MLTQRQPKPPKPRKYVNRQQLPHLCWWLIIGTNILSWCIVTQAISSSNRGTQASNEQTTMKPLLKTATLATTTTAATIMFMAAVAASTTSTSFNTTNAFDTEIHFKATRQQQQEQQRQHKLNNIASIAGSNSFAGEIEEIEKQPIVMNKKPNRLKNNKTRTKSLAKASTDLPWHELSERLILWPNSTSIATTNNNNNLEWLNLTEVFNSKTTAADSKGSGSSSESLYSTTLSFNHSEHNLFTFHEDCLANTNTLSHISTIVLYSIVCVVGLFGNTLVIWVVLRFSKMQTVTNIYILNLAIADECFLIGIPFLLYTMRICSWKFGDYMCKAYMVSTSITQFTSSIFLLIMAADRYIAVCHPIESPKYRTLRIAKLVSVLAWFTSAILMLPVILFASTVIQEDGINYSCNIDWPEVYKKHSGTTFILYTFLLGFATPLCFILVFYYLVIRKLHSLQQKHKSKEKKRSHRKVTRLVLTVITVYILCWLPHWISQVSLISAFVGQRELSRFEILLFLLFGCLAYSNSAMNPILYAFLSDNFRKSFTRAFTCMNPHEVEAQLINEHSVFTHKRTTGGGAAGGRKNSKHLIQTRAALDANTKYNNCSFLAPTIVHNSASASGVGGSSSATSTSTATTNTDKSSNVSKKTNELHHLNGDVLVMANQTATTTTTTNKDEDERIHMVVSHDQRSYGFKTELCHVETQKQTDV